MSLTINAKKPTETILKYCYYQTSFKMNYVFKEKDKLGIFRIISAMQNVRQSCSSALNVDNVDYSKLLQP